MSTLSADSGLTQMGPKREEFGVYNSGRLTAWSLGTCIFVLPNCDLVAQRVVAFSVPLTSPSAGLHIASELLTFLFPLPGTTPLSQLPHLSECSWSASSVSS